MGSSSMVVRELTTADERPKQLDGAFPERRAGGYHLFQPGPFVLGGEPRESGQVAFFDDLTTRSPSLEHLVQPAPVFRKLVDISRTCKHVQCLGQIGLAISFRK